MMNKIDLQLEATCVDFHEDIGFYIPLDSGFFQLDPEDQSIIVASKLSEIPYQELAEFLVDVSKKWGWSHDYLFENYELDRKTRIALATFRSNPFLPVKMRDFCITLSHEKSKFDGRRQVSNELRKAVIAHWGKKCFYCKKDLPDTEIQIDHFTAFRRGGRTNLDNLLVSCQVCNATKNDMPVTEFLQTKNCWRGNHE